MRIACRSALMISGIAGLALAWTPAESRADYVVTNLVSDIAGLAANTDANLKNPWGVSFSATSPFWVSDQGSNKSTLYNGSGVPVSTLVVSMPTATGGPTGQVSNNNSNDFTLANGKGASFLFANLNGQIDAWNGGSGMTAQAVITATNAVYTGLAIGQAPGGTDNLLFAANSKANQVDVYNSSFQNLNGSTYAGAFNDTALPAGFKVFNVQDIGGIIYVTYDNSAGGTTATNGGVVAEFGLDGHFIGQLIANGPGGPLEDPWGLAIAPTGFGQFGGDLLVGNKEQGTINAFDPNSGAFLGTVATIQNTVAGDTNAGLWALTFGNGGSGGSPNTLYAAAGINDENDGLIVAINPSVVPEPGSWVLLGIGAACVVGFERRRRAARRP